MSDFLSKLRSICITVGKALKTAGIATWSFLKTPFGLAVTLLSILTITSTVMLSIRLYDFVHVDDKELGLKSGLDKDFDLFSVEYNNEAGDITVEGAEGQKVIAPGTSVEYTLRFRNMDTTALDYQLNSGVNFSSGSELPLQIRILDPEDKYILGSETEWATIAELNSMYLTDTLIAGESAEYIFQWKWDYEGNDANDTLLGNSNDPVELEVTMSVYAAANTNIGLNGGFMKSGLGEIVFTSVVIATMGGSLTLLLVPYIKKKIAEKKALEALGGLGDSDE